ncbi:MAG: hypothetical protein ABJA61_09735 [Caldimonas sp.]
MLQTLLTRLIGAVFAVPLLLSRPLLRLAVARKRRTGAWRVRPPTDSLGALDAAPRVMPPSSAQMRAMRDEMRRVLDADESHRETFRHLARFERKFTKYGVRAIEEIPVDQLRRALSDFEALVRNWSSASLADLRSRMAVTLADRTSAASVWVAANSVSSAFRPPRETMALRLSRGASAAIQAGQQADLLAQRPRASEFARSC